MRKKTFAEQVSGLTARQARRTTAVTAVLGSVALVLADRAGARLSGRLEVAVCRMTLLRLIRPRTGRPRGERVAADAGRGRVRAVQCAPLRDETAESTVSPASDIAHLPVLPARPQSIQQYLCVQSS
jgi:hypothetical protein